uniref:Uncharacterized protein n=1 Tax=Heliothis virescens TaxID=7102 RepID=A0A2A4K2I5_HELVI
MTKSQVYYYEDVVFQMELNLQDIRRDLIQLLEEYKFKDCLACNRLKCCCSVPSRSTTISITSSDSALPDDSELGSKDMYYYNAAPPADTLPKPRWPQNTTSNEHAKTSARKTSITSLNNWIKASIPNVNQSNSRVSFPVPRKVLDHVNYSWPPFPKSIWSDERLKETTERERNLCNEPEGDGNSSVEAFFKYFSGNRPISKNAFAC